MHSVVAAPPVKPARVILLVEDDAELRATVREVVAGLADSVSEAETIAQARRMLMNEFVDLVVLDLGMPDESGEVLCREMRESGNLTPVLVLSARDEDEDRVALLDLGADDYMGKPFSPAELRARTRALLRRAASGRVSPASSTIVNGNVTIDLYRRLAMRDTIVVHLTPIEWRVLEALAENAGRAVSAQSLFRNVWEREYGDAAAHLRVRISCLRRKVEPDPTNPRLIITVPGEGYRLSIPAA
ncbi:MAG: response regulator transcription factor [Gemmatimonadaceae bacterium]